MNKERRKEKKVAKQNTRIKSYLKRKRQEHYSKQIRMRKEIMAWRIDKKEKALVNRARMREEAMNRNKEQIMSPTAFIQ